MFDNKECYFVLVIIAVTKSSAGRLITSSLYRGNTDSCGARWVRDENTFRFGFHLLRDLFFLFIGPR